MQLPLYNFIAGANWLAAGSGCFVSCGGAWKWNCSAYAGMCQMVESKCLLCRVASGQKMVLPPLPSSFDVRISFEIYLCNGVLIRNFIIKSGEMCRWWISSEIAFGNILDIRQFYQIELFQYVMRIRLIWILNKFHFMKSTIPSTFLYTFFYVITFSVLNRKCLE